jgi:hypothetical protein
LQPTAKRLKEGFLSEPDYLVQFKRWQLEKKCRVASKFHDSAGGAIFWTFYESDFKSFALNDFVLAYDYS